MRLFRKAREENYDFLESVERPNSYVTESIQKLIINLEYANVDKKYKAIQITSTLQSEGKTTLAGNIGYLLAQRGRKTIVVDLDFRKSKINRIFSVPNDVGVTNYLSGSASLNEVIKKSDIGVDFITSGEKTSSVAYLLESKKIMEMMAELKEQYDYIILDSPPVQVNADAMFISKITDGVIYVIGYDSVKKNLIRESIDSLRRTNTPIIGIAFTQVKLKRRNSYYYYY